MKFSFILKKSLQIRSVELWKLSSKAFGPKIFPRDDSEGIRIDGKRGGFVDRTRP